MCSTAEAQSIEKLQERSLRFVLNDFTSEYGVLIDKYIILDRLRQLCAETYKATNGLAPRFVSDIFHCTFTWHT